MIRQWSLNKIDKDFADERETKQLKINQIKTRMAGKPNWWHGNPGSLPSCNITNKVTEVEPTVTKLKHNETTLAKEFNNNCEMAKNLKQKQNNDNQMCFKKATTFDRRN